MKENTQNPCEFWARFLWSKTMMMLTDDEVALIRSLLTALRSIKVREIDKALVILSKSDRGGS